jgi:heme/copper-type cytochrome/quinol oxidase subunit 3
MRAPAVPTIDDLPASRRPHSLLVATGLTVAAGAMLVAGMIGIFLTLRNQVESPGANWVPRGIRIPNAPLGMAVFTAILSSITAQWVVWSNRRQERGHTLVAVGVTIALGVAWINMVFFSFNFMELPIGSSQWANMAYTLAGMGVAIGMVAIGFLALMAIRVVGGEDGEQGLAPVASAVFFWHFSVAAFIALWYVVFVVK